MPSSTRAPARPRACISISYWTYWTTGPLEAAVPDQRRPIREQIGAAVNSADLAPQLASCDVDRVAALGTMGFVRDAQTLVVTQIDPRGRLGACLLRLKYGDQRNCFKPAMYLFANHLGSLARERRRGRWKLPDNLQIASMLLLRFSGGVICEWLHERCPHCWGRGRIALDPQGRRLRVVPKNMAPVRCRSCYGTGRSVIDHPGRAIVLHLPLELYRKHWQRRWELARNRLEHLDGMAAGKARRQLDALDRT